MSIINIRKKQKNYGGYFDTESKLEQIKKFEQEMLKDGFWDNKREAEKKISSINYLKEITNAITDLKKQVNNNIELLRENNLDKELLDMINDESNFIKEKIENLNIKLLLSGKFDKNDCILEIHPGAGGTESQDWAQMLERMYLRYAEKHSYKCEIIDEQIGEEAGIKSVSFIVHGLYAYGYLKSEKGVHRLVRLSPFDSNNRRHTSFASVDVTPIFEKSEINIEINPSDLKIDVYRSSGCGGQGVNTTDSAVRITHLPTKIVVTCQNERSQIQNKERALEVLKSKLYKLELDKRNKELQDFKGNLSDINFGSQIRSYVMHPYSLVKDNRTNTENSNVQKVLDGDIDIFINDNLKLKSTEV